MKLILLGEGSAARRLVAEIDMAITRGDDRELRWITAQLDKRKRRAWVELVEFGDRTPDCGRLSHGQARRRSRIMSGCRAERARRKPVHSSHSIACGPGSAQTRPTSSKRRTEPADAGILDREAWRYRLPDQGPQQTMQNMRCTV